jgi:hypothetical protein
MANSSQKPAWSYLYIVWLGVVCSVLLIVNFNLVNLVIMGLPFLTADVRISQLLQFFVPIVLIFVEFWIYDLLIDRSDRADDQSAGPSN